MSCGCKNSGFGCSTVQGCSVTIDANCVIYNNGIPLDMIGTQGQARLEQILLNINERIRQLSEQVQEGFIGVNVGGGAEVYKGPNSDGIGELRTFIATDSIAVTQNSNTISLAVKQSFIDSILDPITGDISTLVSRVDQLESDFTALEARVSNHDTDILTLQTQYADLLDKHNLQEIAINNLSERINLLQDDLNQTIARVSALEITSINHGQRITALEQLITELSETGGILATEEIIGESQAEAEQYVISVSKNYTKLIGVYFNGSRLRTNFYQAQNGSNLIIIRLNLAEITITNTDYITVDYTYLPDNILTTLSLVKDNLTKALAENEG